MIKVSHIRHLGLQRSSLGVEGFAPYSTKEMLFHTLLFIVPHVSIHCDLLHAGFLATHSSAAGSQFHIDYISEVHQD